MKEVDIKKDWCDAQLQSLWWENSGRDLVLSIVPPNEEKLRRIRFEWVHELAIELSSGNAVGGMPLVWQASFDVLPNSEMSVLIGGTGRIRFTCSALGEAEPDL